MKYTEALEVPIKSKLLEPYNGVIYELVSKEDWFTLANTKDASIEHYLSEDPSIDRNKSYPFRFMVRKLFSISKGRVFNSSRLIKSSVHPFILYNYSIFSSYIESQKKIVTHLSTYCKDNIVIAAQNNLSSTN